MYVDFPYIQAPLCLKTLTNTYNANRILNRRRKYEMLKKTLALHFAESPPTEMIHNINSSRALSRLCFADPSKNGVKHVKYSPFA